MQIVDENVTGIVMTESVTVTIHPTTEVSINAIAIATTERIGNVVRKKAMMITSKDDPGIILVLPSYDSRRVLLAVLMMYFVFLNPTKLSEKFVAFIAISFAWIYFGFLF